MEFYKEYIDIKKHREGNALTYYTISATDQLNKEVKHNPQWRSEVQGYTYVEDYACILVRWVGLSTTPFKGDKL